MSDNMDDLEAQMRQDELMDAIKLSPREFAELVGMSPQLVYYYIRNKKVEKETCICGRSVVDVKRAKVALGITDPEGEDEEAEEEA